LLLGEPRGRLADVARIEAEGLAAVEEAARPGVQASAVAKAFRAVVTRHGLPDGNWFWGHGIGLEIYELPRVRIDSTDVLEEGMVFNFEAPFREVGLGGIHVEDTFVVTADGCRRLSTLPRGVLIAGDSESAHALISPTGRR
jgi:Xaa-Pro aminopeptidase